MYVCKIICNHNFITFRCNLTNGEKVLDLAIEDKVDVQ